MLRSVEQRGKYKSVKVREGDEVAEGVVLYPSPPSSPGRVWTPPNLPDRQGATSPGSGRHSAQRLERSPKRRARRSRFFLDPKVESLFPGLQALSPEAVDSYFARLPATLRVEAVRLEEAAERQEEMKQQELQDAKLSKLNAHEEDKNAVSWHRSQEYFRMLHPPTFSPPNPSQAKVAVATNLPDFTPKRTDDPEKLGSSAYLHHLEPYDSPRQVEAERRRISKQRQQQLHGRSSFVPSSSSAAKEDLQTKYFLNSPYAEWKQMERMHTQERAETNLRRFLSEMHVHRGATLHHSHHKRKPRK